MSIEIRGVSLKVETLDSLYLIPVDYNNITIPLIFDTGASITAITKTTALSLMAKETERTITGGGNAGKINNTNIAVIPEISLGNVIIHNQEVAVVEDEVLNFDFGEEFGKVQLNGFLGWDIIQKYRWIYDNAKGELALESPYSNSLIKNMAEWDNMPIISVMYEGKEKLFGIDTGNTESVLGEKFYYKLEDSTEINDSFAGIDGTSVEKVRVMDKLVLQIANCNVTLKNIIACKRSLFPTKNNDVCGLLGADILKGKSWMIDYKNRSIEIW
ncbi:retropepsin-like aspartic protease [Anaerocolumna chitinilytica]|uniref:Peptidase A2 domain-containing protein n=1 Tax=Anaerocolumna chitinilytica TaxID=1727145 RepID=A0A7I8DSM6_9FIRM|nr:retropepsin-like aspartic protease [Anaerocolumna chitinilytica]BCJ99286.1 hypothetical protein bsdcttw_23270 [Anaerocolumna chitinilytica]